VGGTVELLVLLEKITDLAASICRQIIHLSEGPGVVGDLPAIRRLAEIVPEMLRDALRAIRANDRPSAELVLGRGLAMDTCFAQAHLDLLQVVRQETGRFVAAQQLHAVGRALERIGDGAGEIAACVALPVPELRAV
jgi:phosphate uptake regulator